MAEVEERFIICRSWGRQFQLDRYAPEGKGRIIPLSQSSIPKEQLEFPDRRWPMGSKGAKAMAKNRGKGKIDAASELELGEAEEEDVAQLLKVMQVALKKYVDYTDYTASC